MYKLVKWAYRLGFNRSKDNILRILEKERDFHSYQEQVKAQREYDEQTTGFKHKTTPKQHGERRRAIEDALNKIDPEQYPDINSFMDSMS